MTPDPYQQLATFADEMATFTNTWIQQTLSLSQQWFSQTLSVHDPEHPYQIFQEHIKKLSETFLENLYLPLTDKKILPAPLIRDARFQSDEWNDKGFYEFLYKSYQLMHTFITDLIVVLHCSEKEKNQLAFFVKQYLSAIHPANFAISNPQYLTRTILEQGSNVLRGLSLLLADIQKKYITQTDDHSFVIGKNLAPTAGDVVFKNTLIELIHYHPITEQEYVHPILFIPPCINKFYILDISEEDSFVRFFLNEQFPTYMVSWKNIDHSLNHIQWDDYVRALSEVLAFLYQRHQQKIHMIAYCIGAIISFTTLNTLQAQKRDYVQTVTTMATMIDHAKPGDLLYFFPSKTDMQKKSEEPGILFGEDLRTTFTLLRPEDLFWPYVTNNYLLGETPKAFDILFWSNDAVNLSQPMAYFYLYQGYTRNLLKEKNAVTVCDIPVDLTALTVPLYFFSSEKDHIIPWTSAFDSMSILNNVEYFVLGSSGHTRGVVPSSKSRKNYYRATQDIEKLKTYESAEAWYQDTEKTQEKWWHHLSRWIQQHTQSKRIPARQPSYYGNKCGPAPGQYVLEKTVTKDANDCPQSML